MHVLVTGASGFVASHLIPKLLANKHSVTAFIRRRSDGRINPTLLEMKALYGPFINIVRGDMTDYQDVEGAIFGCERTLDLIFHLASQSFVPDSVNNPSYTHEVNATGTLNILEAARTSFDNPKILYTSSSEVYGYQIQQFLPLDELSRVNPMSPYASAKLYGEWLCKNYYDSYGVRTVITRAFNHEGVNRGHHFVTASVVRQMVAVKKGETDRIYVGNLDVSRDWSHVSDIVDAYIMLAEKGVSGATYVIGSGVQTTIADFINRVAMLLSIENFRVFQDPKLTRKVDVPRLQSRPDKVKKLGWKSQYTLDDIITQMIAYYMGMTKAQRMAFEPEHEEGEELMQESTPSPIGDYQFSMGVDAKK